MIKVGTLFKFRDEKMKERYPETFLVTETDPIDGGVMAKSPRGFSLYCKPLPISAIEIVETKKNESPIYPSRIIT